MTRCSRLRKCRYGVPEGPQTRRATSTTFVDEAASRRFRSITERLTTLEWRPPLDPATSGEGARVVGQQEGAILDLADQSAPIARRLFDVASFLVCHERCPRSGFGLFVRPADQVTNSVRSGRLASHITTMSNPY